MDGGAQGQQDLSGVPPGVQAPLRLDQGGKIEPDAFYAWSEKAREKKAACDEGIITLEEYQEWLKNS